MKSSCHDMTYSRHDNCTVCREKRSLTSLRDLVFRELLPVFAGLPRDLVVKANLMPGTVSDQSFSACSRQSVSFNAFRTADVSFCFGGFLLGIC